MTVHLGAFGSSDPNFLKFLKQYGVEDVVGGYWMAPSVTARLTHAASLTGDAYWTVEDALGVRQTCEAAGLNLIGFENPAPSACWDRIKLGQPGRDGQIESLVKTVLNMGKAGVHVLGYNWMINPPDIARYSWRTSFDVPDRGGATAEAFDMERAKDLAPFYGREYSEEEFWTYYTYFIKAIIPACEEAGVRLAVHPDDPPVPRLGGIPRLFSSVASHDRALAIANSPASGLNFCLGNWTATGIDTIAAIDHFGRRGQIIYGHAQGVRGAVPSFRECFLDESDCDFLGVIEALNTVGFDGPLCPAHYPSTIGDSKQQHHGNAFAFGYVRAMIQAALRTARQ